MNRLVLQAEYWRRYQLATYDLMAGPSPWYRVDAIVQILARDACNAALTNSLQTEVNPLDRRLDDRKFQRRGNDELSGL